MSEIFISYARSTARQAHLVAEALRSLRYSVWIDDDLPAHRGYTEVIQEHLTAAGAVVVIWSAEAVRSEWVQSEADRARGGAKLVQLTVDGAALPMPFDRIQCADMTGWSGEVDAPGWRKVVASVRALLDEGRAALPGARSAAKPTEPLLAVLAFDNLSGDAEMTYFSDGVSEEILQTVARGAELKVIGRGSSFQFRGADKAAAHVASQLKATHVLDGSVRRSGAKVRIAANLIECAGETTLWSDRFDRELSDVFALQDEIAAAVAAALKVAFAPTAKAEAIDPLAYTLYLKARDIRNNGLLSPTTVLEVIGLLDEATRRGPKFARAWEFLATMKVEHLRFDETRQPEAITRADVIAAAEAALRLDPGLGAAYQALGQLQPFGCFAEREALHRKALAVAPNDPTVLTNASLFFAEVGRIRESLKYAAQAYALDPMYPWAASWYGATLEFARKDEECVGLWKSLCERWPDNELIIWGAVCAAVGYRDWAWFDDLLVTVTEKGFSSPTLRGSINWGYRLREPSAEALTRELERAKARLARTGVVPLVEFATLHLDGLAEETFELIAQSSFDYMFNPEMGSPNGAEGPSMIFNANVNVAMVRDIRFVGLCARLGLCSYWAKSDYWPDCADDGLLPYDFKAEARRLTAA
jgi:adenylate cyclase